MKRLLLGVAVITAFDLIQSFGASPALTEKKEERATQVGNNPLQITSGMMLLTPYVVNITKGATTNGTLEKADGTRARFYVEAAYHEVWAWDVDARRRFLERYEADKDIWFWGKGNNWDPSLDFQARFNYIAQDDKETTVAAVIGTGEFGGEVTLGVPIWRRLVTEPDRRPEPLNTLSVYNMTRKAQWAGLIISYSGVTDSDAFDLHSRYFVGGGYRAARKDWSLAEGREFTINVNGGVAFIDSVDFLSSDSRAIRLDQGDLIDYETELAFGFEAELNLPLTGHLSAILGTRLYAGMNPNVWNAYVGISIDNLSALLGLGGNKSE